MKELLAGIGVILVLLFWVWFILYWPHSLVTYGWVVVWSLLLMAIGIVVGEISDGTKGASK